MSVHAVRAGSLLVEVVAEYLERSLTLRPSGAPSAVRLLARVQAAVTRSLTDGAEGADAPDRTDADDRACGADEYDLQLLDVVRDSTRRSREAMAREIHDRVGSAAGLALRRLELYELTRGDSSATDLTQDPADAHLDALRQAILETMHSTRDIVTGLRAGAHPIGSLGEALSAFVTAMAIEEPVVEIRVEDLDGPLPDSAGEDLFLVLRECLRNALAHAHASRVTLDVRRHGPRIRASVSDDGVGLPPEREFGNGLAAVAERIVLLGGRMEIESARGQGTTLLFSVPTGEESHADAR
ncbi:sensor histidine kinase [Streptomyces exfoliatus]|uniref:sensor histidine kinase n=1 Tax=Streptomyces exfoliatus TaxID=1905 RepID=UPI003C2E7D84